jgi:hypothetical protein
MKLTDLTSRAALTPPSARSPWPAPLAPLSSAYTHSRHSLILRPKAKVYRLAALNNGTT